jgi:hypothetical protein
MVFNARAYARSKLFVPEVRLARGPTAEGVTGLGTYADLYGRTWAITLDTLGILHLLRESNGIWNEIQTLSPLPVLAKTAKRISLAFDQAGKASVAWEDSNQVFISQFDILSNAYVTRGPFAGVDPLLWIDAQVLKTSSDSDVILFCLNPARDAVKYRLQRDQFGIESNLIAVTSGSKLEAVITETYRYNLILSDVTDNLFMLQSTTYPHKEFSFSKLNLGGGLSGGAEFTNVLNPFVFEQINVSAGLTAGEDFLAILNNPLLEQMNLSAGLTAGEDFLAILNNPLLEKLNLSAGLTAGEDFLAILNNPLLEQINISAGLTGGEEL